MKLSDHLSKRQQEQLDKMRLSLPKGNKHKKQRNSKPNKEEHIDWVEMMGTKRDIYKRVRGAVRRK